MGGTVGGRENGLKIIRRKLNSQKDYEKYSKTDLSF